jgi:replicative DNA helicase
MTPVELTIFSSLLQSSITASNINHYVSIVKDQAVLRETTF